MLSTMWYVVIVSQSAAIICLCLYILVGGHIFKSKKRQGQGRHHS